MDFKVRDISVSGMALETHGLVRFNAGDPCPVSLPGHGEVATNVVAVKPDTCHLRFNPERDTRVVAFLKAHTGVG